MTLEAVFKEASRSLVQHNILVATGARKQDAQRTSGFCFVSNIWITTSLNLRGHVATLAAKKKLVQANS